jgi:hypothetical protein
MSGTKKIIIVDDDDMLRETLTDNSPCTTNSR